MPSDPRVHVHFMLSPAGRDWIDDLAHKHRLDRSKVLRAITAIARQHPLELDKRLTSMREEG